MTVRHITRQNSKALRLLKPNHILVFTSRSNLSTIVTRNDNYSSKEQTFMYLLKRCSTINHITQLHTQIIKSGVHQNLFVIGKVIAFCAVSTKGDMGYAVSVFRDIENPDGFLWNTMIRGFGKASEPNLAFQYYKRMQDRGEVADNFTFSFLLKICGQLGLNLLGSQIHCEIVKRGLESHVYVRNTLVHMYGLFRDIDTASQLFEEMPMNNLVAWNSIIDCHVYCRKFREALDLFSRMLGTGIQPDEATLVVSLAACSQLGELDFGKWIHHSWIENTKHRDLIPVNNALVDMYVKSGAFEEAYAIFTKMKDKGVITWNIMILGLAIHGHAENALALFEDMLKEKLERPDEVTFLGVLSACSHGGMVDEGRKYFNIMRKHFDIEPTAKHYGCMVDLLGRAGLIDEAYRLIMSMPMKCNAVVWRTLLAACRLHGEVEIGVRVRERLLEVDPEHSSDYVLLANMYASNGQWDEMLSVRKSMKNRSIQKPEPGNSIVGAISHVS
ncbi:hypothetical protein ACFE04_009991 [Oxalis oulophora]